MTRSQKHLHMTTVTAPGNNRHTKPSPFWYDVLEFPLRQAGAAGFSGRPRGVPRSRAAISADCVDEIVDRHFRVPFAYPTLRETMRASAKRTVAAYIEARKAEFAHLEFSEKSIELSLGNGVSVSGRIDLVRRRDSGKIAIVDLKSNELAQAELLTELSSTSTLLVTAS